MTYDVYFTDAKDGYPNHKILEADAPQDIHEYMTSLGHTDIKIKEI